MLRGIILFLLFFAVWIFAWKLAFAFMDMSSFQASTLFVVAGIILAGLLHRYRGKSTK